MRDPVEAVKAVVHRVASERVGQDPGPIEGHHRLTADLQLKSLDLARVVAALELELEVDPFAQAAAITDMQTVGDLCAAYGGGSDPTDSEEGELSRSQQRAQARLASGRSRRNRRTDRVAGEG